MKYVSTKSSGSENSCVRLSPDTVITLNKQGNKRRIGETEGGVKLMDLKLLTLEEIEDIPPGAVYYIYELLFKEP